MSSPLPYSLVCATAGDTAEIDIFGGIGWKATAESVRDELQKAKGAKTINVRLNSPGGSVPDGLAIYHQLRAFDATINVTCIGMAASMGSVILQAASGGKDNRRPKGKRKVSLGTMVMVHNPSYGFTGGTAAQLRKDADTLDKWREGVLDIFESTTGNTREALEEMMQDDDLWLTAQEAVDKGFADEVLKEGSAKAVAVASAKAQANAFANVEAQDTGLHNLGVAASAAEQPNLAPQATPTPNTPKPNDTMKAIAAHLGLSAEASEESILAALKQREAAAAAQGKGELLKTLATAHPNLVPAQNKDAFEALAETHPDKAVALLQPAQVQQTDVTAALQPNDEGGTPATFSELLVKGYQALEAFQKDHPEAYAKLYKAHYGFAPQTKPQD